MGIEDTFSPRPLPYWTRLILGSGDIEQEAGVLRLVLEPTSSEQISDAQIHDYYGWAGAGFPWQPPLALTVRARFSHPAPAFCGTAGFGFWNNPFTVRGEVVGTPNCVWFFYASPPSAMELVPGLPGWGWKAALLDTGRLPSAAVRLAQALLRIPALGRPLSRLARRRMRAAEALLPQEMTTWHTYRLQWTAQGCTFWVDGEEVLRSRWSPTPPLGFVAWVDNQYAIARPDGSLAFGRVPVPQRQWLELAYVRIEWPGGGNGG